MDVKRTISFNFFLVSDSSNRQPKFSDTLVRICARKHAGMIDLSLILTGFRSIVHFHGKRETKCIVPLKKSGSSFDAFLPFLFCTIVCLVILRRYKLE